MQRKVNRKLGFHRSIDSSRDKMRQCSMRYTIQNEVASHINAWPARCRTYMQFMHKYGEWNSQDNENESSKQRKQTEFP